MWNNSYIPNQHFHIDFSQRKFAIPMSITRRLHGHENFIKNVFCLFSQSSPSLDNPPFQSTSGEKRKRRNDNARLERNQVLPIDGRFTMVKAAFSAKSSRLAVIHHFIPLQLLANLGKSARHPTTQVHLFRLSLSCFFEASYCRMENGESAQHPVHD
jgi:hypothetical protein